MDFGSGWDFALALKKNNIDVKSVKMSKLGQTFKVIFWA